jgi:hypothetical protein
VEGGRALAVYAAMMLDRARHAGADDERKAAQRLADLLTPVAKAFLSDRGVECAVLAQQVFGGHGYIAEHGMEQIVRDVRITPIYEGANGIQALDFIGRKVLRDGGRTLGELLDAMRGDEIPGEFVEPLHATLDAVERTARDVLQGSRSDPDLPGAAATDFLELTALVLCAWAWARMAGAAGDDEFGQSKRLLARFYYAKLLPKTAALERSLAAGAESLMAMPETMF